MAGLDRTFDKNNDAGKKVFLRPGFNGFVNPKIAGSVKIHKREWEGKIFRKIDEFQQGSQMQLCFEAMDNQQRKRVHEIASRLGLLSHSQGRDPNRFVVIMRKKKPVLTSALTIETSLVELTPSMHGKIREFMKQHPIGKYDVENHLSVQLARKSQKKTTHIYKMDRPQPMLIPPKSMHSPAMLDQRKRLPAFGMRVQLLDAIQRNRVVLITGGTGCGKTTQVPQFLLEEANQHNRPLRIICTQPRRLPAIAVAERVSKERGEAIGGTVGYHIRLEMKTSQNTVLTYCTSGVLLRMLTQDDAFKNVSHIILDEIHEREQNTDYLLIALKQALLKEKDLKIVLMSATMEGNLDIFKNYFGEVPVQHIDIPSRLYNVEKMFLGDVLALTGYTPPESIFSTSSFVTPLASTQSFPEMSNWGEPEGRPMQQPLHQIQEFQPRKKATFGLGGAQFSTPPPTRPVQHNLFSNLAQQLTTSQAMPQPPPQGMPHYTQGGMHHSATWSGGMDQPQYNDYPPNQECIEYQANSEDFAALQNALGEAVVPNNAPPSAFTQQTVFNVNVPPPDWNCYKPTPVSEMQYFNAPMDGHIYPQQPPSQAMAQINPIHPYGNQKIPQQTIMSSPFGRAILEEREQQDQMRRMLQMSLPNRTRTFEPESLNILHQGLASQQLNSEQLAYAYKKLGGPQYGECVDVDLIICLARYLMDSPIDGAILIFLPGYDDIIDVKEKLGQACQTTHTQPDIYTLHSQMNTADQHKVFERSKQGLRKVILSTNIAEASLTIDDVVFVIDTGKVKEKTYDHNSRINQLKTCWIARSNAEQRSGRAGRCREGFCFRLYSLNDFHAMPPTQKAEMQRAAIHEVCLHAKIFAPEGMSVRNFLSMAPEPPPAGAIDNSMVFLEQLGAFYSEASTSDVDVTNGGQIIATEPEMTDLGLVVAKLPLDPQLARMLLFGLTLKVLCPVVTLVAALSHRDPFVIPTQEDRERCNRIRDHFSGLDFSDHLALLRALTEYEQCKNYTQQVAFCRGNFLNLPAMKMIIGIRKQLLVELKRANLIYDANTALNDANYNQYSDRWPMVQIAITAGCYPGIGYTKAGTKLRKIRTSLDKSAGLHPSSVIKRQLIMQSKKNDSTTQIEYLAYQELAQLDEGLTLKTVTVVPPIATILSTGLLRMKQSVIQDFSIICEPVLLEVEEEMEKVEKEEQHNFGIPAFPFLTIDDWFAIKGTHPSLRDVLRLRFHLMSYFLEVIADSSIIHETNPCYEMLLQTVADVLDEDHSRLGFKAVDATEFYNREKITRQHYPADEQRRYNNDNRNNYNNDNGRYHGNNRGGYNNQDRGHQHFGQQLSSDHDSKDFLVKSGYQNVEIPKKRPNDDYRGDFQNYDKPEPNYSQYREAQQCGLRNGAGLDNYEGGSQNYSRPQTPRYNDGYDSRGPSPRYNDDGYSQQQRQPSPRYNQPADDNGYDDRYNNKQLFRGGSGRRSYSPRQGDYEREEEYDPPPPPPPVEDYYDERDEQQRYRNQGNVPSQRYNRDRNDDRVGGNRRGYNDQRRDDGRQQFGPRDFTKRGSGPGFRQNRNFGYSGRGRGGGGRGNYNNRPDNCNARGGVGSSNADFNPPPPEYKVTQPPYSEDNSYDDEDYDGGSPSRTSPVNFPSQDIRVEQGKASGSGRNQQSSSRHQNFNNRDRTDQRDDRSNYKDRNNVNRDSRCNDDYLPRPYDGTPRDEVSRRDDDSRNGPPRPNDGPRTNQRQNNGGRRQNDRQNDGGRRQNNDNFRRNDGTRRPNNNSSGDVRKQQQSSGPARDDRDAGGSGGGFGYGGRQDRSSKNEVPAGSSQQRRNGGGNFYESKSSYRSNANTIWDQNRKFQSGPSSGNNRNKPRSSPSTEDPPPADPVHRNNYRGSNRSKKQYVNFGGGKGGQYRDKKPMNDNKGDDGAPADYNPGERDDKDRGKDNRKQPMVFENSNFKRSAPRRNQP